MKIAIVHDFLVKMGGAERVVAKLMEMYPEAPVYTLLYDEKKCGEAFPKERVRTSFLQKLPRWLRNRYQLLLLLTPYAIEAIDLMDYDLIISSSGAFSHGALTSSESVHICYCHSPMRYAWDYTHNYMTEKKSGFFTILLAKLALNKMRFWDQVAADRPDIYVANSSYVSKRIAKYYRQNSVVIYPPVDVSKIALGINEEDYFLIISTLTPYKKIDLAVSLFNKVGKRLVIIGDGPQRPLLEKIAGENVKILGRLSDQECRLYLEKCRAFVQMNEEDFGMGMVEAMAAGKPVLAYGKGGALEIVEPGVSGELFRSYDLGELEHAVATLIRNEKNYNPQEIRNNASRFSAENFEKQIFDLVKKSGKV